MTAAELEKRASEANYDPVAFGIKAGISQRTLERHCRKRFACTFKQLLERLKFRLALTLIAENKSTKEIALCLGYKQESHFCKRFKRVARCTFGEAKALIRSGTAFEVTFSVAEKDNTVFLAPISPQPTREAFKGT